jgi:hypothetical protein
MQCEPGMFAISAKNSRFLVAPLLEMTKRVGGQAFTGDLPDLRMRMT